MFHSIHSYLSFFHLLVPVLLMIKHSHSVTTLKHTHAHTLIRTYSHKTCERRRISYSDKY